MPTTARAQWRLNWSKGHVARWRLGAAVEAVRESTRRHRLVACHHPLIDPKTRATTHTRGGARALEALVNAGATAVLSGHVHDPYDVKVEVNGKPIRLVGAGTLSERVRATAPSYNAIFADRDALDVEIRFAA